jgi:hypothetical protein
MIYYRLALKDRQTSKWIWKSTVLTSLEAVLHLLRIYSPISAERIRVFSSTCKEEMAEMLKLENDALITGSRTAEEFLRERCLLVQDAPAQEMVEKAVHLSTAIAIDSSTREHPPASQTTHTSSMDLFDQRRLQIELGPGGDHDTPYCFSLPISTPQLLAWTRMLGKAQVGEIQS